MGKVPRVRLPATLIDDLWLRDKGIDPDTCRHEAVVVQPTAGEPGTATEPADTEPKPEPEPDDAQALPTRAEAEAIVPTTRRKRKGRHKDESLTPEEQATVDRLIEQADQEFADMARARLRATLPPPETRHQIIMRVNDRLVEMPGFVVKDENPDSPDYGEDAKDQEAARRVIRDRQAVHKVITEANDRRAASGQPLLAEDHDDPDYNQGRPAQDQARARRAFLQRLRQRYGAVNMPQSLGGSPGR